MAFLDDLGKKITQTGQDVVQKTKDTADVLKFNAAISEEEKQILNLYGQLGKVYFEKNGNEPDAAFKEIVQSIKSSYQKIEEYKNQINILKGVAMCTVCGAEIQSGSAFCSSCGSKVKEKQPENSKVCSSCGAVLKLDAAFCTNCGAKVVEQKICSKCGNNVGNSAFCTNCGTKVESEPQPTVNYCPNCNNQVELDSIFCTNCGTKLK